MIPLGYEKQQGIMGVLFL